MASSSFHFSFSEKLKFSVCIRFSLFNLIICNDSLSYTVTFKCSFTLLVCWQWETNIFFFIEGEKKSCSLCPWNFWIVASGNADTFNEEINMFVFYSAYLWMKRRAVMLWRVVLFPLLVFASSWGGVSVQPLNLAGLWAVLSPGVWHFPTCAVGSAVPAARPDSLCQPLFAQLGLEGRAGPSPWAAGVQIPPTGMSNHFSDFSSGDGMGNTMLRKQKKPQWKE